MNKKAIILCVSLAAVLLAGIAVAVAFLYSGTPKAASQTSSHDCPATLQAVPSDAAAVLCFSSLDRCVKLLDDSSKPFGAIVGAASRKEFRSFLADLHASQDLHSLTSGKTAVSLHFSGALVPLMVLDAGSATQDTTQALLAAFSLAAAKGLCAQTKTCAGRNMFICSPSETTVASAIRHIENSESVLDDKNLVSLLERSSCRSTAFFSNQYASKLLGAFLSGRLASKADFFRTAADWTSFEIRESSDKGFSAASDAVWGRAGSYYMNVIADLPSEVSRCLDAIPAGCVTSLGFQIADYNVWKDAYDKYLDAGGQLKASRVMRDSLKHRLGCDTEQWAAEIKEVVHIDWKSADGQPFSANLFRLRKAPKNASEAGPWAGKDLAATLYGPVFALQEEDSAAYAGEWMATGSQAAVADWVKSCQSGETLKQCAAPFADALGKGSSFFAYCALPQALTNAEKCIKEPMLTELRNSVKGTSSAPLAIIFSKGEFSLIQAYEYPAQEAAQGAKAPSASLEIPKGPFKVKNCLTGKTNTFYQNESMYLCLKDENGKGLWGVPFSEPLCGRVQDVDFYANGKIQFLFAAGSKIYLISRLGSFVTGFPVDLGKEVLLGPDVYDFTGGKGYNIIVLHSDNTIDMYNLKGQKPAKWLGIKPAAPVTGLPELIKKDSGKYWKVPVSGDTLYFDFWGGEPVKEKNIK